MGAFSLWGLTYRCTLTHACTEALRIHGMIDIGLTLLCKCKNLVEANYVQSLSWPESGSGSSVSILLNSHRHHCLVSPTVICGVFHSRQCRLGGWCACHRSGLPGTFRCGPNESCQGAGTTHHSLDLFLVPRRGHLTRGGRVCPPSHSCGQLG